MVRTETGSGATLAGRPELRTILDFIHPGETLVVTRIDRLARSMRDLQVIVATLKDKGAHLAATEQPVDTSTAAGKAFFDMLSVFAEFETNLRRERQRGAVEVMPLDEQESPHVVRTYRMSIRQHPARSTSTLPTLPGGSVAGRPCVCVASLCSRRRLRGRGGRPR